ncbi:DamX protein [Methylomarinovum caldicuralii]|uniref:DamX protein n=1 Tax=Methylomarinovum caldicuralii TaxID=438856 RepID=A0AAU9C181_9GAMM|nr:SPOR domain-containing protein [Methylomarinovum caldicuralii]BCX82082.1 DamX protein [Methylomarinovum caldicuralii]
MSTAEAVLETAPERSRTGFDFLSSERQQKFDLLLHLLANLPRPLLVSGPEGIGKSTFLRLLQQATQDGWRICRLQGGEDLSFEGVQRQLAECLGLANAGELDRALAQREAGGELVILAIDDGGDLLPGVLDAVCRLAVHHPALRVVVTLRPDDLHVKTVTDAWAIEEGQVIELPPLDLPRTRDYVLALGARAGQGTVDEALVREIYHRSHGIPARIREQTQAHIGKPPLRWHQALAKPVYIALALLIAVAAALTYWQQRSGGAKTQADASAAVAVEPVAKPPPVAAEPQLVAGATEPQVSELAPQPPAPPPSPEEAVTEPVAESPALDAAPAAEPVAETAAAEAQPLTPAEILVSLGVHTSDWLLQQPGQYFTLQIAAFDKLEELAGFVREHSALQPLAYYRKQRRGRAWYPLLYGVFPTLEAARQAQTKLPPGLRKPWLRRLRSVQKEIRALQSP